MYKIRLRKINTFLDIGILLICIKSFLTTSIIIPFPDIIDNFLTITAIFVLIISIIKDNYSIKSLMIYSLLSLAAIYTVLITGDSVLLLTLITCIALSGHDFNKEMQFIFNVEFAFVVIHVFGSILVDVMGGPSITIFSRDAVRYRFGLVHPNMFSLYIFNLEILWTWLNYDKIKIKNIYIILLISLITTLFTKTRTSLLATAVFCILIILSKSSKKICAKLLKFASKWSVPICTVFIVITTKLYIMHNNIWTYYIDKLLTGRIHLGAYAYSIYRYTFLGQPVNYETGWNELWGLNGFTFDNVYNYLLINQGAFWAILVAVLFLILAKNKSAKVYPFVIIWALYGMTEIHVVNGFLFFPILLLSQILNVKYSKNKFIKIR